MTKVEEIGKAIYESRNGAGCAPWGRQTAAHKSPYLSDAIAAIKAMREPSERMVNSSPASHSDSFKAIWPQICADVYRAMIDAAVAEHEGGER